MGEIRQVPVWTIMRVQDMRCLGAVSKESKPSGSNRDIGTDLYLARGDQLVLPFQATEVATGDACVYLPATAFGSCTDCTASPS